MLAIKNILVATDFSACSEIALTYGRALAHQFGARLHVLHAVEPTLSDGTNAIGSVGLIPELQTALDDAERARLEDLISADDRRTLQATTILRTLDTPAHAIVEYAQSDKIDLIVIGTHGRHGLAHAVMGSVAERVVRTASCPVLTVRDHEREFVGPDALVKRTASTS
jgi:nucleotide-binding universal stress UspA family protein